MKWKCYAAAGVPLCLCEGATFAFQVSLKGQHLHFNRHTAATEGGALRLKWKCCAAAAPAQRARRAVFSLSNVQAVAATTSPRRPQCCSKCLSRRARTFPPRRWCNLHVCSPSNVQTVSAPPRCYPERLFRHARTLPPRSGRDAHFAAVPTFRPSLPPLPRVAPDTAPTFSPVTRERFPHAAGATSMFAALPTYRPSLPPLPRATPVLPHTSPPSRGNAAPAPRAKPPCSQSFCRNTCKQAT